MRSWSIIVGSFILLTWLFGPIPARAADPATTTTVPDVATIVDKMKDVFEPTIPRTATVTVTLSPQDGEEIRWVGRLVGKVTPQGKRTLLVMLEPRDIKGTAFLVGERKDQTDVMWVYLPPVDRIRQIVPVDTYQRFLGTDFTYADLGFVSRQGKYRLVGKEEHNGKQAYKIEFVPTDQWYYSRILTWVDADSFVPLQRDYYDVAGKLWKTQVFEKVAVIDDHFTPLRIEMRDMQQGISTTFTMTDVQYNSDLPDTLFDPTHLRVAAAQTPQAIASGK